MRERMQHLEAQVQWIKEEAEVEGELRLILGQLETFATNVKTGLQHADFSTRREIIRTLVKRAEVDEQHIRVIFRVGPTWSPSPSEDPSHNWQDCGRRVALPCSPYPRGCTLLAAATPVRLADRPFHCGNCGSLCWCPASTILRQTTRKR